MSRREATPEDRWVYPPALSGRPARDRALEALSAAIDTDTPRGRCLRRLLAPDAEARRLDQLGLDKEGAARLRPALKEAGLSDGGLPKKIDGTVLLRWNLWEYLRAVTGEPKKGKSIGQFEGEE